MSSRAVTLRGEIPFEEHAADALFQLPWPARVVADFLVITILVAVSQTGVAAAGWNRDAASTPKLDKCLADALLSATAHSRPISVSSLGVEVTFRLVPDQESAMPFIITGIRVAL